MGGNILNIRSTKIRGKATEIMVEKISEKINRRNG